jgi:nucleotide-binding universal stress UspA family protein
MNITRILFPTDLSHYGDAALNLASSLASETGAMLHIVYVQDTSDLNAAMGEASYLYARTWEEDLEKAQQRLQSIEPAVAGVRYEQECLTGNPAAEILRFAELHNVDLIVMASRGRTGLSRLLMGSVAEAVMRRATCPVFIVKQPAGDAEEQNAVVTHAVES